MRTFQRRSSFLILGAVLTFSFVMGTRAGILDRLPFFRRWSSANRVESLIITGNYAKSRLLAELVQHKTKQPIVLISPLGTAGVELFFLPSGPEAMTFGEEKYVEFIDFLHPGRIIILGNESYVPAAFVDKINDVYPTVMFKSSSWTKNAEALASVFEYDDLPEIYDTYLEKLGALEDFGQLGAGAEESGWSEPVTRPQAVLPVNKLSR